MKLFYGISTVLTAYIAVDAYTNRNLINAKFNNKHISNKIDTLCVTKHIGSNKWDCEIFGKNTPVEKINNSVNDNCEFCIWTDNLNYFDGIFLDKIVVKIEGPNPDYYFDNFIDRFNKSLFVKKLVFDCPDAKIADFNNFTSKFKFDKDKQIIINTSDAKIVVEPQIFNEPIRINLANLSIIKKMIWIYTNYKYNLTKYNHSTHKINLFYETLKNTCLNYNCDTIITTEILNQPVYDWILKQSKPIFIYQDVHSHVHSHFNKYSKLFFDSIAVQCNKIDAELDNPHTRAVYVVKNDPLTDNLEYIVHTFGKH